MPRVPVGALWLGPFIRTATELESYSAQIKVCMNRCGTQALPADVVCVGCGAKTEWAEDGRGGIPAIPIESVAEEVDHHFMALIGADVRYGFWLPTPAVFAVRDCVVERSFVASVIVTPEQVDREKDLMLKNGRRAVKHLRAVYGHSNVCEHWGLIGFR